MASEEIRKKWGTIYMGNREASLEELNAMQEPLRKEQEKKEKTEDYMERVKARAADRAREILGAAYTERQKVLDEAKGEAAVYKKQAAEEGAKLKAEGERLRQMAHNELAKAEEERKEAQRIRETAYDEGFQNGMDKAAAELHEFRADLGQSLAALLRAIERQRRAILETWRGELAALTQTAAQAGTGLILQKEHQAILNNLVFQALDLLENRSIITMRVNPADETTVSDMFRAAREKAPELKQWIVTGDSGIEAGGLIAETANGSVDLQRDNFRELVHEVLMHLGLPEHESERASDEVRDLVEREVAHIASLTPELDAVATPAEVESHSEAETPIENKANPQDIPGDIEQLTEDTDSQDAMNPVTGQTFEEQPARTDPNLNEPAEDPTLAELEEELFPLEDEIPKNNAPVDSEAPNSRPEGKLNPESEKTEHKDTMATQQPMQTDSIPTREKAVSPAPDSKTFSEGGFL